MDWQLASNMPIYSQLARLMRIEIASGRCAPGAKLESVRELALSAGVNPNTMQRAMAELEREGLVFPQRTSGRYVTEYAGAIARSRERLALEETERYMRAMEGLGCTPGEILRLITGRVKEDGNAGT